MVTKAAKSSAKSVFVAWLTAKGSGFDLDERRMPRRAKSNRLPSRMDKRMWVQGFFFLR